MNKQLKVLIHDPIIVRELAKNIIKERILFKITKFTKQNKENNKTKEIYSEDNTVVTAQQTLELLEMTAGGYWYWESEYQIFVCFTFENLTKFVGDSDISVLRDIFKDYLGPNTWKVIEEKIIPAIKSAED